MRIYIKNGARYYRADVTPQWARYHDNGALISCGLIVPDSLSAEAFKRLGSRAVEVSRDDYNHSGCLSRCVRRGDNTCQW